jgi:phytoene desaturase
MGRIPAAVEGLFRGFGGTLLTGTEVEAIVLIDHRAIGVRLSDGETLQARAVVSNIHVQKSYLDLVGREHLSRLAVRRMESLRFGHSYFGVQLGLDCQVRGAANTPVLPPLGELESFWAEVEERVPAHLCPNVAVVPVEAKVAPPGGSVVCVYHVAPLHPGPGGWAAAKEGLAERLLDSAEAATGLPVRRHVVTQRIRTPVDFEQQLRLPQGAMYGLSPTLLQSGPFRPRNRSPWIRSLYLVGQTTHPGLGVASVMASGATTARLVIQDLAARASG